MEHSSESLPQEVVAVSSMPLVGHRVDVYFGREGFAIGQPGNAPFPFVLMPSSHTDGESPAGPDPSVVRVCGTFPIWSVTLKFECESVAKSFEQEVSSTSVQVVQGMHADVASALADIQYPTFSPVPNTDEREGQFLCGGYVLVARIRDNGHNMTQDAIAAEVRFCLRWMELRVCEGNSVELLFYNHHGPRAHLVDVAYWNEDETKGRKSELTGHILSFRDPEIRGAYRSGSEVKHVLFLAFQSGIEAEGWADMATGALHKDCSVTDDARQRLQASVVSQIQSNLQCFARDDREVVPQLSAIQSDAGTVYWVDYYERRKQEIREAVQACIAQDVSDRMVSSDTCVIIP